MLYVSDITLYSIRSGILSQCRFLEQKCCGGVLGF